MRSIIVRRSRGSSARADGCGRAASARPGSVTSSRSRSSAAARSRACSCLPPRLKQRLQLGLDLVGRLADGLALLAGQLAQPLEDGGQFAALASQVARAPVLQRLGRLDVRKLRSRSRAERREPPLLFGLGGLDVVILMPPAMLCELPRHALQDALQCGIQSNKKRRLHPGTKLPLGSVVPPALSDARRDDLHALRLHCPAIGGQPWCLHTTSHCAASVTGSGVNFGRLAQPGLSVAGPGSLSVARRLLSPSSPILMSSVVFFGLPSSSSARRCRAASKSITLAAMAAFSDSTLFHIGMLTRSVASRVASADAPCASLPMIIAVRSVRSIAS